MTVCRIETFSNSRNQFGKANKLHEKRGLRLRSPGENGTETCRNSKRLQATSPQDSSLPQPPHNIVNALHTATHCAPHHRITLHSTTIHRLTFLTLHLNRATHRYAFGKKRSTGNLEQTRARHLLVRKHCSSWGSGGWTCVRLPCVVSSSLVV